MRYDLIVITGPTASGKTRLASILAYQIDGEIISADSRQIFRKMTIGTGKDLEDYTVNKKQINYHLIDIKNPGEYYSAYNFLKDFITIFKQIKEKNKMPILCGGTGLYISTIVEKYEFYNSEPNKHLRNELEKKSLDELKNNAKRLNIALNKSDINNKRRLIRHIETKTSPSKKKKINLPDIKSIIFAINIPRNKRKENITKRLNLRLKQGMIEEVESLIKEYGYKIIEAYGLEYKYITMYLKGKITYNEMVEKLSTAIYRFSKRQMTWFRRMEKHGIEINWLDYNLTNQQKIEIILEKLK